MKNVQNQQNFVRRQSETSKSSSNIFGIQTLHKNRNGQIYNYLYVIIIIINC